VARHGRRNAAIYIAAGAANLGCVLCCSLLYEYGALAYAGLLIAFGYASLVSWLTIHECIHYSMFKRRSLNVLAGRAMSVLFGCPFHALRAGHLMHHKVNRTELEPSEMMFELPRSLGLYRSWYYARLLGLFHLGQMAFPLVLLVRRVVPAALEGKACEPLNRVLERLESNVSAAMVDGGLCFFYLALIFVVNAEPIAVLIMIGARALTISFHDNLYHYGNAPGDRLAGHNVKAGRVGGALILNSNLHRTHHRHPRVSWDELPSIFAASDDRFDGSLVSVALQQFNGPIRVTLNDDTEKRAELAARAAEPVGLNASGRRA
jgi:fatty acid desaturase